MRMTSIAIAAFAAAAAANLLAAPKRARPSNIPGASFTPAAAWRPNCGFTTVEQCRLTVSGIGGFCEEDSSTIRLRKAGAAQDGLTAQIPDSPGQKQVSRPR